MTGDGQKSPVRDLTSAECSGYLTVVDKGARPNSYGLRRISWVRIDLTGDYPRAEVAGVGQHRPVTRTVPMSVAAELSCRGVPTYIRRHAPVEPDLAEVG